MRQKQISINNQTMTGLEIDLPAAPLVLVRAPKGFVMCGYLDRAVSEKFGQAAAIVKGIKSVEELLDGRVIDVTRAAGSLGIKPGMTGREALEKLI
ncbi:MAG: DUF1805 domain-containing protein [Elusimicrobia bacterium]|nr:DUF1805 domain-containing protein [Elusimicrobiota bacterium]MBD3411971.1 DUF1805 domain-containing protein [Elusimicrobiota bacterium]